jgi:leucyl aminopeptidase
MHEDMGGSAIAVATLQALTEVGYPFPVDCWLAITENRLSAEAYKSRDIVTASNGTTIEVIHTDAEGRMALADALALAGREKPGLMIDFATLTGACYGALSPRYSGVFTNRQGLNAVLTDAGVASGERVWPFPMDADFDTDLESKVADIVQCSPSGEADHILASRFLARFVPKESPWIHVDLSAVNRKGGLAQMPSGVTGFGVRFTMNLLLDQADAMRAVIGNSTPVSSL